MNPTPNDDKSLLIMPKKERKNSGKMRKKKI